MHGRHHLAERIERCLLDTRRRVVQLIFFQSAFVCVGDQCSLGRLTGHALVLIEYGIAAERHCLCEQLLVIGMLLDDGHLVLRQCTGLIRADDLRTAERLNGSQSADDRAALGHIRNTD